MCILCRELVLLLFPQSADPLAAPEGLPEGIPLLGHRCPLSLPSSSALVTDLAPRRPVTPLSMDQAAEAEWGFPWSFFNVIIIYRGNIHCSHTDDRLQSTGVYSHGHPRPLWRGRAPPAPVPYRNSGPWEGASTRTGPRCSSG